MGRRGREGTDLEAAAAEPREGTSSGRREGGGRAGGRWGRMNHL